MLVAQLCLTLCDSMDCSPPGSSVHGISQARILDGLPFPSPGVVPNPGTEPSLPHCRQVLYHLSHQGSPDGCDFGETPQLEEWRQRILAEGAPSTKTVVKAAEKAQRAGEGLGG